MGIFWDYLGIYNSFNIQWRFVRVRVGFPRSLFKICYFTHKKNPCQTYSSVFFKDSLVVTFNSFNWAIGNGGSSGSGLVSPAHHSKLTIKNNFLPNLFSRIFQKIFGPPPAPFLSATNLPFAIF